VTREWLRTGQRDTTVAWKVKEIGVVRDKRKLILEVENAAEDAWRYGSEVRA
jgi:hypothetical protein